MAKGFHKHGNTIGRDLLKAMSETVLQNIRQMYGIELLISKQLA